MIKHLARVRREGRTIHVEVCPEPGNCAERGGEMTCKTYTWRVDPPTWWERLLGISHRAKLRRAVRRATRKLRRAVRRATRKLRRAVRRATRKLRRAVRRATRIRDRLDREHREAAELVESYPARLVAALHEGHPDAHWSSDVFAVGEEAES